jgi:hypothetical protein
MSYNLGFQIQKYNPNLHLRPTGFQGQALSYFRVPTIIITENFEVFMIKHNGDRIKLDSLSIVDGVLEIVRATN